MADWDDRVLSSGSTCVFHSRAWAQTLSESYGFIPRYLTRSHNSHFEVLAPLMEVKSWATRRKGVSLPFSDYCNWLVPADEMECVFHHLHEEGIARHWQYLDLRHQSPWPATGPASEHHWHHELDLKITPLKLWENVRSEVRTAIRKAQASKVEVRFTRSLGDLQIFFKLHKLTRKKQGIPPHPWFFLKKLYQHVISSGLGEIGIANRKGVNLAAAIFFHFGHTALYKYGASDPDQLPLRGNNALLWAAILRYAENGSERLSLGRTEASNEGLRHFKLGWGCRESPLDYFRYDYRLRKFVTKPVIPIEWVRSLLRMAPLPLLTRAGNWLYPHRS